MRILVCIKQVPDTTKVAIDPVTGSLIRSGAAARMNPYDLYSLEAALRLKDSEGCQVDVLTMGPPNASEVIKEALGCGADHGYLISDRAFAGADVLATSMTLKLAIRSLPHSYDLILCGKQTTDGDTAQVGPALADLLGIAHLAWVDDIREVDETSLIVKANLSKSQQICKIQLPCLLTIEKDYASPRFPSYLNLKRVKPESITTLTLKELGGEDVKSLVGSLGSPTSVEKIFPPESETVTMKLEGKTPEIIQSLNDYLLTQHQLSRGSL
ncbi:MAG: hypothetical protein A2Y20_04145 [Firmicutes bacterium GWF2_51_9]|nr:electron transfer flavoprotein subunit beta/FixA family protein [Erysipelotrichaceae bacterium]OGS54493.1 MAG: hypothetical protein A2Y20_04145 [Firmicutes bacterium GWF2_51_9]OGS59620.1 MAG: hypothetical protein A2Y19_01725 [Firmicutes bacterium GWE2_51_13]HBZ41616.1 electron transfer flavoprotein subunit beta [Erysipelotrichaceae bacterium]